MSTEQVKRCCEIAGCVLVFWPRDSQSGIARPPCRHGNNRSALRFYWNSPRIPPPPICRGSRGRQGSNVGPTPSQSSSPPSSCHVMVTRDGIALHFLHRRAIDVLSPRSTLLRGTVFRNPTQSRINNPLVHRNTLDLYTGGEEVGKAQVHLSKMGG